MHEFNHVRACFSTRIKFLLLPIGCSVSRLDPCFHLSSSRTCQSTVASLRYVPRRFQLNSRPQHCVSFTTKPRGFVLTM